MGRAQATWAECGLRGPSARYVGQAHATWAKRTLRGPSAGYEGRASERAERGSRAAAAAALGCESSRQSPEPRASACRYTLSLPCCYPVVTHLGPEPARHQPTEPRKEVGAVERGGVAGVFGLTVVVECGHTEEGVILSQQ